MKLSIFLFILLLSACNEPMGTVSVTLTTEEKAIAEELIQGSFDHIWGGLDSNKIKTYHTDDFIILEQGEIWTNQEVKNYIRTSLKRENRALRINKMDFISMDKYGNAINMAYHNYASFMQGDSLVGKVQWLESAIAVKEANGWRLKMMHSTGVRVKE